MDKSAETIIAELQAKMAAPYGAELDFAVQNSRAEFASRMTLDEAKAEATRQAALTGEPHAICDDIEGRLFVCPADQYLDQQLWVTNEGLTRSTDRRE